MKNDIDGLICVQRYWLMRAELNLEIAQRKHKPIQPHMFDISIANDTIEALEYRLMKKPTVKKYQNGYKDETCPICNSRISLGEKYYFCKNCGQAINWDNQVE